MRVASMQALVLALNKNGDPRSQNAYQYGIDLALSLIRPHIQRRSLVGLQMSIKNKMSLILGCEVDTYQNQQARTASMAGLENDLHPKKREKSSRCKKCMSETWISTPYKGARDDQKQKSMPAVCNNCVFRTFNPNGCAVLYVVATFIFSFAS